MTPRMIPAVATRKMAEVFTTAVSRQFLPIGSFSLNYLLDPKSETPPPIGQVRLAPTSAAPAAATTTGRPLLSERPALRAALCELSSLAPAAHIAKGTAWALGAS